jgi:tetratricopeptide (TPR) repeat protein
MRTCLALLVLVGGSGAAVAKGRLEAMTASQAIDDAEAALQNGRIGDAVTHAEKLQKTRGLDKEQLKRVDLIIARCGLVTGKYDQSEKIFARVHKAQPDDARVAEWYALALNGNGKVEAALPILRELAAKDALEGGDSYWALAQLERQKGQADIALKYAKLALEKPIALQSDELDKEIHTFIDELSKKERT